MLRYSYCLAVLAILQSSTGKTNDTSNGKVIMMAFVVNRNGERTLTEDELSIGIGEDWKNLTDLTYLYGPEVLTAVGKRRSYALGKFLRHRYGSQGFKIVSNVYHAQDIAITTTDKDYTKMTAEVAMAALYPPEVQQYWDDGLGKVWQPVPYQTSVHYDYMNFFRNSYNYKERLRMAFDEAAKDDFLDFADVYPILKQHTGKDFSENPQLFRALMNMFITQETLQIKIQKWAYDILWKVRGAAHIAYRLHFKTEEMIQLAGGVLLSRFLIAVDNIIKGKMEKKLHMFSGYDLTVGALMEASKVRNRPVCPYHGSFFALELYKSENGENYYVLPVYLEQAGALITEPDILQITGCEGESFCELSKFTNLTKDTTIDLLEYGLVYKMINPLNSTVI